MISMALTTSISNNLTQKHMFPYNNTTSCPLLIIMHPHPKYHHQHDPLHIIIPLAKSIHNSQRKTWQKWQEQLQTVDCSLEGQSTVHPSVDCTHWVSRLILPLSNPVGPLTLGQSTVDSLSRLVDLQSTDFECQSTASLVLCQSTELARLWEEFPLRQSTDLGISRLYSHIPRKTQIQTPPLYSPNSHTPKH